MTETSFSLTLILLYLFNIFGFFLALILIARLLQEHNHPGTTMAWLLAIVLIPYVGVPLYLLFGGRKLRKVRAKARAAQKMGKDSPHAPARLLEWTLLEAGAWPTTSGNTVVVQRTGEQAYETIMNMLTSAKSTIHITAFILGRDEVGKKIVDLLAEKAKQGVQVRLLLDALGCIRVRRKFVAPIRDAGGVVGTFMPILPIYRKWSANLRNHRKMVLVDGEQAVVGGHNLASEYIGPSYDTKRWQDIGLYVKGPVMRDLEKVFASDWQYAVGEVLPEISVPISVPSNVPVSNDTPAGQLQVIASGPDVARDSIYEAMIFSILRARRRVWIMTPYFVPDIMLFRALVLQARLGHDIQIVVPRKSNHRFLDIARGYYLRDLMKEGVKVHAFEPGMMHGKIFLIDDDIAAIGSANFDMRSHYYNYEISVFMHSQHEIAQMEAYFKSLCQKSDELLLDVEGWRSVLQRWGENLTRLLSPLL